MPIKNIKLSQESKDLLIKLKRNTSISNWNILCRWALCMSLREPSTPPPIDIVTDSNVEMSWETFGGKHAEIYWLLLTQRCHDDGLGTDEEILSKQFKLHLYRGIGYLASQKFSNIFDMLRLVDNQSSDSKTSKA